MRIGYEAKRVFHNHSGLGNFSRNLIRALALSYPGNEYYLYNPKKPKIAFGDEWPFIKELRPSFKNPLFVNIWRQRLLSERAKKDKVDLFHGLSQELPAGLKKRGVPSVVSVHDVIFLRRPELYKPIDRKIYTRKLKLACRQANSIVAISEQTRKDLEKYLDIPAEKVKVIYQGCAPLFWNEKSQEEIEEVRRQYGLPEKYMLFVGTLEQRKNVGHVVKAAQKLNIPLVLIGRATKYWKQYVAPEINTGLIHTPSVWNNEHLAAIYQGANLFTYPSAFEGFGIPVLEALVSKTPVITSNISSLPEVAGPASLLIDPDSLEELTQAIDRVWGSEDLQKQMSISGYTFAQHFKDDKIASHWQNLYSSLI